MSNNLIDPKDCPKCMPSWLATFGDLMSLLLCFFVLLLSMSTMDAKKFDTAVGSLVGALSVLDGGARPEVQEEKETESQSEIKKTKINSRSQNEILQAVNAINELLHSSGSPEVSIKESEDGFVLRLPSNLLFNHASADITNNDAYIFLKRISQILNKLPRDVNVNIIGHTDNIEPVNSNFQDNWYLSAARAISVSNVLIKNKVSPNKLIVSGRASYDPIADNNFQEGRDKNNRVEIHFIAFDSKNKEDAKKSVLDIGQK